LILVENRALALCCQQVPIDPHTLPKDVDVLHQIVLDLCEQLQHESAEKDKYRSLLRETAGCAAEPQKRTALERSTGLFEELWKASQPMSQPRTATSEAEGKQPSEAPIRSEAGGNRWRGIWSGNGWCTIWRKRKSTAAVAAKICA